MSAQISELPVQDTPVAHTYPTNQDTPVAHTYPTNQSNTYPTNQCSLHKLQRRLHASQYSCLNHLLSIQLDSTSLLSLLDYIKQQVYELPIICNLRNGAWYYHNPAGYAYFKSTDGHDGTWNFNLTRINLNVAMIIARNNGAVIIDSTRRGKIFPDSLRTTIPVWIAVLNRLVLNEHTIELPSFMHESMQEDIRSSIDRIITSIPTDIKSIIITTLCEVLTRPMVPIWVSISDDGSIEWHGNYVDQYLQYTGDGTTLPFFPVLLYSVSRLTCSELEHREHHSWHYIQGAGDDEENWCFNGFNSTIFWKYKDEILANNDNIVVERVIQDILTRERTTTTTTESTPTLVPLGDTGIVLNKTFFTIERVRDLTAYDVSIVIQPCKSKCEYINQQTLLINTVISISKCESMQVENERWLHDIIPNLVKFLYTRPVYPHHIFITSGGITTTSTTACDILPGVLIAVVIMLLQHQQVSVITKTTLKTVMLQVQTYLPSGGSVTIPRRYHKILHNYFISHEVNEQVSE
jgi:hypothetical protein